MKVGESETTLTTERLVLTPVCPGDAGDIQRLINEPEIAMMTRTIEYPYPEGGAEEWIETAVSEREQGNLHAFSIRTGSERQFVGTVALIIDKTQNHAELGFWIGKPYWNCGYCSEAAGEVLRYAFDELNLHRVHACHMTRNPASGRVLDKIGMIREGVLKGHIKKWGEYFDIVVYGLVQSDLQR